MDVDIHRQACLDRALGRAELDAPVPAPIQGGEQVGRAAAPIIVRGTLALPRA